MKTPPCLLDYRLVKFHVDYPLLEKNEIEEDSQDGFVKTQARVFLDYDIYKHAEIEERYFLHFIVKAKIDEVLIDVEIDGAFQFEKDEEKEYMGYMIRHQGITTLYGILRGYIGMITSSNTIILPNIIVQEVVKDIENRKRKDREKTTSQSKKKETTRKKKTNS